MENKNTNNIDITGYALGIDEAGRGPVLGPMVYACCFWKVCDEAEITRSIKFADSKILSEQQRRLTYEKILLDDRIKYLNIITHLVLNIRQFTLKNYQI